MSHSFLPFQACGLGRMAHKPGSGVKLVTGPFQLKASFVLITYCCIKSYIKLSGLKEQRNTHYVMVSVGQELGSRLAGWVSLQISREVAIRWSASLPSPEGLTGLGGPPPRGFTRVAGTLVLAVGGRPQSFSTTASPQGCLSVLMTRRLALPRVGDLR